jgi:hypothetical protein
MTGFTSANIWARRHPPGHIVFSAENCCVTTLCDYRGVPGFRILKIHYENGLALVGSVSATKTMAGFIQ